MSILITDAPVMAFQVFSVHANLLEQWLQAFPHESDQVAEIYDCEAYILQLLDWNLGICEFVMSQEGLLPHLHLWAQLCDRSLAFTTEVSRISDIVCSSCRRECIVHAPDCDRFPINQDEPADNNWTAHPHVDGTNVLSR